MADITLCTNTDCPLREGCYRFTAKPDPLWQSYARFDYSQRVVKHDGHPVDHHVWCDHFIDNKPYTQ